MADLSEYERIRLKNIEENRRMLCQLGLLSDDWKPPAIKLHKPVFKNVKKTPIKRKKNLENGDPTFLPGRRSLRASISKDTDDSDYTDSINGEYSGSESGKEKVPFPKRPNSYGAIEGVAVGEMWETRIECSRAGIHRPTVAGIHPGPEGAYSIALSGGYEDNYDGGESFTYTGAGGRDLKGTADKPKNLRTGPQVKDQTLDGANGSLATSVETRNPVRVIRGYKSSSLYAPEIGYRYDGLYQVENYWTAKGASGFLVYKFALKRCPDQDPPPWTVDDEDNNSVVEEVTDKSSENSTNLSIQTDKKLNAEAEVNLSSLVNGKLPTPKKTHSSIGSNDSPKKTSSESNGSPKKISSKLNDNVNDENFKVSSPDERQFCKSTPTKSDPESKIVDSDLKSPKKTVVRNSPTKTKIISVVNETVGKSPVKMIASNQSLEELSTPSKDDHKITATTDTIQRKDIKSATNESGDSELSIKNNVPEDGSFRLVSNASPDIFDGSSPSYLKSRRRSYESSGRNKGNKRSPSPDDFGKICDELCNELPKIEKVKRLRFSFDSFTDNDLQFQSLKTRRKRVSRAPRKSSLVMNRDSNDIGSCGPKSNQDLLFNKYIEMWVSEFCLADNDCLGWEDYNSEFKGWTDKEVIEAKKYTSSFSDFMFKCNENCSFSSDETGWAGWEEDVPRRSLILNGFLLEEISRNRKSFDSDSTDVPEDFLGFTHTEEKVVD